MQAMFSGKTRARVDRRDVTTLIGPENLCMNAVRQRRPVVCGEAIRSGLCHATRCPWSAWELSLVMRAMTI